MASVNTANHIVDFLVKEGKQLVHEHKLVKKMLTPHSASYAMQLNQDLFYQIGTRKQSSNIKNAEQQCEQTLKIVSNINLDRRSYLSMKVNKRVVNMAKSQSNLPQSPKKSKQKLYKKNTIKSNSFVISSEDFFQSDKQKMNKKQKKIQPKCVKLFQENKQLTKYQKKMDQIELNLRTDKIQKQKQEQLKNQNEDQKTSRQKQKHQKLVEYLQNHIEKPNGCFTFHIDGSLLLFQQGNNQKIQKQFPYSIRHSFSQNINADDLQKSLRQRKQYNRLNKKSVRSNIQNQKLAYQNNHKIKGARGQIFNSSVLKTVNLSRISLGVTNGNVDAVQFMKRNDLFNNNHSRQTTSIPFIDVKDGLVYTEVQTNQCISKKDNSTQVNTENDDLTQNVKSRARSQDSRYKGLFKKYATTRYINNQSGQDISHNQSKIVDSMIKRQVKSVSNARYFKSLNNKRPQTQQVGRITTASQLLVKEMIQ